MRQRRSRKYRGKASISQIGTTTNNSNRSLLVLISAILLFIAAAIGLYIAWDNLSSPDEVEVI